MEAEDQYKAPTAAVAHRLRVFIPLSISATVVHTTAMPSAAPKGLRCGNSAPYSSGSQPQGAVHVPSSRGAYHHTPVLGEAKGWVCASNARTKERSWTAGRPVSYDTSIQVLDSPAPLCPRQKLR